VFVNSTVEYASVLNGGKGYAEDFCGKKRDEIEVTEKEFYNLVKNNLPWCDYVAEMKMLNWNGDEGGCGNGNG